jgi:hypothetical protein
MGLLRVVGALVILTKSHGVGLWKFICNEVVKF